MKHQKNFRTYLLGVLTALLLVSLADPALAAAKKMIEVSTGVKIFVDGTRLYPTDANGRSVDVFIYNGTTYLPVRAVGQAVGKSVRWDGSTQSVYIENPNSSSLIPSMPTPAPTPTPEPTPEPTPTPTATWLAQMDYFDRRFSCWSLDEISKDNLGNEYPHSIFATAQMSSPNTGDEYITYKLNGQYRKLTGTYYQQYDYRDSSIGSYLFIMGDGVELWRGSVSGGIDPLAIDIDITGVSELKIQFADDSSRSRIACHTALGDVALWT